MIEQDSIRPARVLDPADEKCSTRRLFFGAAGAVVASAAFAQDAEAATTYATLNANGTIPVAQLPAATSTTAGLSTSLMLAKRNRVLYTADYGCTTDQGVECSTQLQDAINAAAAVGGTLVVQEGVMTLSQPIWIPIGRINVRGAGLSNVLSWEGATFDGPAVKLGWAASATEAQRGKIPGNPPTIYYGQIENLQLVGPSAAGTTVDGWRFGEPGKTDTARWTLDRVEWSGFRHQQIMGDGAFIIDHRSCVYSNAQKTSVVFDGILNCGENLNWTDSLFQDTRNPGSTILRMQQPQMLLDAFFTSCSFINSNRVLTSVGGTFQFTGCHFRSDSASSWFALSSTRIELNSKDTGVLGRQTILMINGGQLVPSANGEGVAPPLTRIVTIDDAFTDGAAPVAKSNRPSTVVVYGAQIGTSIPTRVLDVSRVTDARAKTKATSVANGTFGSWGGHERWNFSTLSWGPAFSLTRNSGFETTAATVDKASPEIDELMSGWCLPAASRSQWALTEDTSTKLFGPRSMKYSAGGSVTDQTMLAQFTRVRGGRQLDFSIIDRIGTDYAGTYDVSITEFDALGREIVPDTVLFTATATDDRNAWRFSGYTHVADRATYYARITLTGHFKGTLWLDSVELTNPS